MHGGGNRKQVETGKRKPVGRPVTHGLYSKTGLTSIQDLQQKVKKLNTQVSTRVCQGVVNVAEKQLTLRPRTRWDSWSTSTAHPEKVSYTD